MAKTNCQNSVQMLSLEARIVPHKTVAMDPNNGPSGGKRSVAGDASGAKEKSRMQPKPKRQKTSTMIEIEDASARQRRVTDDTKSNPKEPLTNTKASNVPAGLPVGDECAEVRVQTLEGEPEVSSAPQPSGFQVPRYSVCGLNPDLKMPWKFVGRVLARNPKRQYTIWRGGGGRLFEVYVSDEKSDIVRVTVFDEGVDSFYDVLTPGTVCSFSNGRVKATNPTFALRNTHVELSFGGDADIHEEENPGLAYPEPTFLWKRLGDLPTLNAGAVHTFITVITRVGPLKKITTRKGKNTSKREFLLVDDTDTEVLCTVWGQTAEDVQDSLTGRVVLVKDAQISCYKNVKSLNVGLTSAIMHNPAVARSAALQSWFASIKAGHNFTSLHG